MFYTVYKITNLINNKIYVGAHKTSNLEDNYMGSGTYITNAINKHGIENFSKEILHLLDSEEEMYLKEKEIVDKEFLSRDDVYNLNEGGLGGWNYVNSILTHEQRTVISKLGSLAYSYKLQNNEDFKNYISCIRSESGKSNYHKTLELNRCDWTGRKHTEETKKKIGEKNSISCLGERNSQYGTMWVHNLESKENKKIKKDDLSFWEQEHWIKGRKMKF